MWWHHCRGVRGHPSLVKFLKTFLFSHWRPCFYCLLVVSYPGTCVTAALRRERGLIGDPNCISTGKNKMGIVFHYQGSDDSILICSLGKYPCICFLYLQQAGVHKMFTKGPCLDHSPPFGQPWFSPIVCVQFSNAHSDYKYLLTT